MNTIPWECFFREEFVKRACEFSNNIDRYAKWKNEIKKTPLFKPCLLNIAETKSEKEPVENKDEIEDKLKEVEKSPAKGKLGANLKGAKGKGLRPPSAKKGLNLKSKKDLSGSKKE